MISLNFLAIKLYMQPLMKGFFVEPQLPTTNKGSGIVSSVERG